MVLNYLSARKTELPHLSDLVQLDEEGTRWLELPGLLDLDLATPIAIPIDNARWLSEAVPRILAHRIGVMASCQGVSAEAKTQQKLQLALCARPNGIGWLYWLYTFGWILEPRNPPGEHELPFLPTPRQIELAMEINEAMTSLPGPLASLAVEKSRDVGATWIDGSDHVWRWLFTQFYTGMLISIDEEAIDKRGDPNCWMFKLDFLIDHLPRWMVPKGYTTERKTGSFRTHMTMSHPLTGSQIKGVASTDDAGRSGRVMKASIDEGGFNPWFDEVMNLLANTTDHRITFSSATLKNPGFYNLVYRKAGYANSQIRTFRFEWNQMPGRDQAWLEAKRASMTDADFRREVLIDYHADIGSWTYPTARVKSCAHLFIRPDWLRYGGIDDGYDDATALGLFLMSPNTAEVHCMAGYQNDHRIMSFYGTLITGKLNEKVHQYTAWDEEFAKYVRDNGWTKPVAWMGDRHGDNTSMTDGMTPYTVLLHDFSIYVLTVPIQELNNVKYRRDCLNEDLPFWSFNDEMGAPSVLEALQMNHLPVPRAQNQTVTEYSRSVHDDSSHYTTMCEYVAGGLRYYRPSSATRVDFLPKKESKELDALGRPLPPQALQSARQQKELARSRRSSMGNRRRG